MGLMIGRWLKRQFRKSASFVIPMVMAEVRHAESVWIRKHVDEKVRHILEERLPELNAEIEAILREAGGLK